MLTANLAVDRTCFARRSLRAARHQHHPVRQPRQRRPLSAGALGVTRVNP